MSNIQDSLIKFGVDFAAISSLVADIFPILASSIQQNPDIEVTESTGTCCNIGDVGGRITAFMRGFTVDPINEDGVSIATSPGPGFSDKSVRLLVNTGRIKTRFAEVGAVAGFAFFFPVECTVSLALTVEINSISFIFDFFSESPESDEFTLRASNFTVNGVDIRLRPLFDTSSTTCSIISATIGTIISLLSESIETLIFDSLTHDLNDFAQNQTMNRTIDMPSPEPVNIVKTNTLALDFHLPSFFVEEDSIVGRTTLGLEAVLNTPSWRVGRKYSYSLISENDFSEPAIADLVNANIGSDGVNYIVDMLWYLVWSDFATDEKSATSPLCQPTKDDPCPLPPFRQEFGMTDLAFWPLFLLGARRSFILSGVIQPPRLDFETDGLIRGTAQALFLIDGITFIDGDTDTISSMTANVEFFISLPEFDETTGLLSGLQITEFSFDDFDIEESPLFRKFYLRLALNVVERVLNRQILSRFTNLINEATSDALSSILHFPTIPDFPIAGQSLEIKVTDMEMSGESGAENSQSYASLGTSISMGIVSNTTVENTTIQLGGKTFENSESPDDDMREKLMNTMIEWSIESNGNPDAYFMWSYQNSESDILESHIYHFDSSSKLVERDTND